MKALSLWQPWASLIAIGAKRIETRSWGTDYRGPIAIHAAKRKWTDLYCVPDLGTGITPGSVPYGAIIAAADLVDCREIIDTDGSDIGLAEGDDDTKWIRLSDAELSYGDYRPGRFAWFLDRIDNIHRIPLAGRQRLFNVPDLILITGGTDARPHAANE